MPRTTELHQEQELGKASRRLFLDTDDNSDDHLPLEYRYLRDSERKVKDKVYTTLATLVGIGLSVNEASKAVVEVGKGMFDRNGWRELGDKTEGFDSNSMPDKRSIRDKLKLIEAQSLSLVADEIIQQKNRGGHHNSHQRFNHKESCWHFCWSGCSGGSGSSISSSSHGDTR